MGTRASTRFFGIGGCLLRMRIDCHTCGASSDDLSCRTCGTRILPLPFRRGLDRFEVWSSGTEEERQQIAAYWSSFPVFREEKAKPYVFGLNHVCEFRVLTSGLPSDMRFIDETGFFPSSVMTIQQARAHIWEMDAQKPLRARPVTDRATNTFSLV